MARTAWHVLFLALLKERRAAGFFVQGELVLSHEPQRADFFLLRRPDEPAPAPDSPAILPDLWSRLPRLTIGEFKSHARPLRRGDVWRLLGYVAQYVASTEPRCNLDDICSLLVVARPTRTLRAELAALHSVPQTLAPGYTLYTGPHFPLLVLSLREIALHEHEPLTGMFSDPQTADAVALHWLREHTFGTMSQPGIQGLEGYDEMMEKALATLSPELRLKGLKPEQRLEGLKPEERLEGLKPEERLEGLKPEERLEGLKPEERLAGLDEAHAVLAFPRGALRALSAEYIDALPDDVRAEVKRRLAQP